MPAGSSSIFPPLKRVSGWRNDLLLALLATLVTFAIHAADGFSTLQNPDGDNDALMRMVQVRDLIAGQGWFDLTQYRMGLEGGFLMHWSRLVDAPIAVLVVAGTLATSDQALGEAVASVLWPQFLYATALFLILQATRRFAGGQTLLPAFVIGAVSLHALGLFTPGALDHHTAQLVLTLALVNFLLAEADDAVAGYGAGSAATLMLAIGVETLPYVAIGGVCAAMPFLLRGKAEAGRAGRFGLAFGLVSLCVFVLTVPHGAWLAPQCDAFSVAQASLAAGTGFGLWAITRLAGTDTRVPARAAWLAALAGLAGAVAALAFPQCLGDPLAGLDPRLRTFWLDGIREAQSITDLLARDPAQVATYYATSILGLILLGARVWRRDFRRRDLTVGGFLAAALLVSFWQVRGSMFSAPLAVIPLSAWVAEWREQADMAPSPGKSAKVVLAWLLSANLVWHTTASAAEMLLRPQASAATAGAGTPATCYRASDYGRLAALPPGTVLAISNLGASILGYTPHRVLAGPYHRNVDGNLTTLDALMGPIPAARHLIIKAGVDYLAFCPGNNESGNLATWSPLGLEAALRRGAPPQWLSQVPSGDQAPLRVYRVTR